MIDDTTVFGATDVGWRNATDDDRQRVINKIKEHARDGEDADLLFEMITGRKPTGSETRP
jgi:hypothetical protein